MFKKALSFVPFLLLAGCFDVDGDFPLLNVINCQITILTVFGFSEYHLLKFIITWENKAFFHKRIVFLFCSQITVVIGNNFANYASSPFWQIKTISFQER